MIRYGIISTAQVVPRFVAGVKESQSGEVVALASRNLAKAQQVATELDIPKAYGSYEELYADSTIDIVYIATYNQGHYAAAKQALSAGKSVLLEKPFTLAAAEAEELFALAKAKGLFLMEAQKALFLPATTAVRQGIAAGVIGEVKRIESVTSYPHIDHISWFHDLAAGGGVLRSSGSYPLQYMQQITGEKITSITGTSIMPAGESDLQTTLALQLGEGILASVFLTVELDLPSQMTIYGTKGKIVIPHFWKADRVSFEPTGEVNQRFFPFDSEFVYEVEHVNDCLKKGRSQSPVMTPELTIETVKQVEGLYQSWQ